MSKLSDRAKSSKLNKALPENDGIVSQKSHEERVVRQIKPKEYPRSYRLDPEIMNALKATVDKINEISPKKVSEARLIKALIHIAPQIDQETLMKALKEVW
jgi:hypothetical protein